MIAYRDPYMFTYMIAYMNPSMFTYMIAYMGPYMIAYSENPFTLSALRKSFADPRSTLFVKSLKAELKRYPSLLKVTVYYMIMHACCLLVSNTHIARSRLRLRRSNWTARTPFSAASGRDISSVTRCAE